MFAFLLNTFSLEAMARPRRLHPLCRGRGHFFRNQDRNFINLLVSHYLLFPPISFLLKPRNTRKGGMNVVCVEYFIYFCIFCAWIDFSSSQHLQQELLVNKKEVIADAKLI